MEPVLARLLIRYTDEEQVGDITAGADGGFEGHLVVRLVGTPPAKRLGPEPGERVRVGAIDVDALDTQGHPRIMPRRQLLTLPRTITGSRIREPDDDQPSSQPSIKCRCRTSVASR